MNLVKISANNHWIQKILKIIENNKKYSNKNIYISITKDRKVIILTKIITIREYFLENFYNLINYEIIARNE